MQVCGDADAAVGVAEGQGSIGNESSDPCARDSSAGTRLVRLQIEQLRNIEHAVLHPADQTNFLVGRNASGKSSILEGIFFLSRGRSFRTNRPQTAVQRGETRFRVLAKAAHEDGRVSTLGIERDGIGTVMRADGRNLSRVADLAVQLPVLLINHESLQLVDQGPEGRRRFLDWGVFHVEHRFFAAWQRFRRALQQRNALLRRAASDNLLEPWEQELGGSAAEVDLMRRHYLAQLIEAFREPIDALLPRHEVTIDYARGWPADDDYGSVLRTRRASDKRVGHTTQGPHRADLRIRCAGEAAVDCLSRGQQKSLVAALFVAQARAYRRQLHRGCIMLIDDLAAELDAEHAGRVLAELRREGSQLFITAVAAGDLPDTDGRMFHVEHGKVKEMV